MSLMDKMIKTSNIKETALLSKSNFMEKTVTTTPIPMINVALSGSMDGGLHSGLTVLAGPSKHFKTTFALLMAKAYLDSDPESIVLFYDSEFGASDDYFSSFNIDPERVLHCPIKNIEELKFDIVTQLEGIERKDNVFILIDSIGNLASKKEIEDAKDQKSVADMTRAKQIKSLFRMVTPYLTMNDIPMVAVAHTYQTQEMFSKNVVSGGCVVEDTNITMRDGSLKHIQDINTGEFVKTIGGYNEVTNIWNPETLDEGNPECYEIEFDDGYKVICSDKHKFIVNDEWVEAKLLNICDDVKVVSGDMSLLKIKNITKVGRKPVYDLSVKDDEHYILENGVVTHNTGITYSADQVWIIGRSQNKEGKEVIGYDFNINIEKGRYVKEKSKIPITVSFEGGMNKYSGMLDVAVDMGYVLKPKVGWYTRVLPDENGEVKDDKNWRAKDTSSGEFWNPILNSTDFKDAIERKYKLATIKMLVGEEGVENDE